MTSDDLKMLAVTTLRDPARAVALLRGLNLPMQTRWMALLAAVSLSALLAWGASVLFPVPVDTPITRMTAQPLVLAVVQLVAITLSAVLMAGVGRLFGGKGRFADALLLTTWIEVMLLIVQAIQVVLMLLFPAIATLLGLVGIALFFYLLVQFSKALHGFDSAAKVAMVLFATLIFVGFAMATLAGVLGLAPELPPVQP